MSLQIIPPLAKRENCTSASFSRLQTGSLEPNHSQNSPGCSKDLLLKMMEVTALLGTFSAAERFITASSRSVHWHNLQALPSTSWLSFCSSSVEMLYTDRWSPLKSSPVNWLHCRWTPVKEQKHLKDDKRIERPWAKHQASWQRV